MEEIKKQELEEGKKNQIEDGILGFFKLNLLPSPPPPKSLRPVVADLHQGEVTVSHWLQVHLRHEAAVVWHGPWAAEYLGGPLGRGKGTNTHGHLLLQ